MRSGARVKGVATAQGPRSKGGVGVEESWVCKKKHNTSVRVPWDSHQERLSQRC